MIVNGRKPNEMLIGQIHKDPAPKYLTLHGVPVQAYLWSDIYAAGSARGERASDLKQAHHVDAIKSKMSSRLYLLKKLKRESAGPNNLLCFYSTVIYLSSCRVRLPNVALEPYCCCTKTLESQRSAMRTVFPDNEYSLALAIARV